MLRLAGHAPFGVTLPPDETWLASADPEEVIDPDLPIVDPHHHFWDLPGNRYLLDEFLTDLRSGHRIIATVHGECGRNFRTTGPEEFRPIGETEFVTGLVESGLAESGGTVGAGTRICEGIVGQARLDLGVAAGDVLDGHIEAANGRFRGIRHSATWHPDPAAGTSTVGGPHLYRTEAFLAGARELARRNLTLDAWVYHTQLDDVIELAQQVPELVICLNHLGGILGIGPNQDRHAAVFREWSRRMARLARCENVTVKLGGLVMRLGVFRYLGADAPPGSTQLSAFWGPWINHVIELFGADRCMFESNFPADKMGVSYRVLWNGFKRMTATASAAERRALFADTARRVYRLS